MQRWNDDNWLISAEVEQLFGISGPALRYHQTRGRIEGDLLGKRWWYRRDHIKEVASDIQRAREVREWLCAQRKSIAREFHDRLRQLRESHGHA
jgi:hypothetical protein